jgi:hypothetical protein
MRNIVILGGSSHPTLTKSICNRLGVSEGATILGKFSNGETSIQIQESVRGKDVFIITTGCGEINEILMELFIMLSACKTASARRIIPGVRADDRGYYGVTCVSIFKTTGCALCETGYSPRECSCHVIQGFFYCFIETYYAENIVSSWIR